MNIHEFQAKKILAGYGVNIPRGKEAYSVAEAVSVAKDIEEKNGLLKPKSMLEEEERQEGSRLQIA